MLRVLFCLILGLTVVGPAWADEASAIAKLREELGGRNDRVLERIQNVFVNVDRDGDGITREEIAAARDADNASMRAMRLSQAVNEVARNDLDGNGTVTRSEIETSARYSSSRNQMYSGTDPEAAERVKVAVARLADSFQQRYDFNQDGKVELTEVIMAPTDRLTRKSAVVETSRLQFQLAIAEALMPFDADKDGNVTEIETMAAITKAFKQKP